MGYLATLLKAGVERVERLVRPAAPRDEGPAWSLDGPEADAAFDEALRRGTLPIDGREQPIVERSAWRAETPDGGAVAAYQIGPDVIYLRYAPPAPTTDDADLAYVRSVQGVWDAVLALDPAARWRFVHDFRGHRGIPRRVRVAGARAYLAVLPRLRQSVIVVPPAQDPFARAFAPLYQGGSTARFSVHRTARSALRECLGDARAAPSGASEVVDDAHWLADGCARGRVDLAGRRWTVRAPEAWRLAAAAGEVRFALLDERLLVGQWTGEFRDDEVERLGPYFDLLREEAGGSTTHFLNDLRGMHGISLGHVRRCLRVLTPQRLRWLPAATHLARPSHRLAVRIFQGVTRGDRRERFSTESLADTAARLLTQGESLDAAPRLDAERYREAMSTVITALSRVAVDVDAAIATPPWADPLVRDLFEMLSLVQEDIRELTRSLRESNEALEEKVRARTADLGRAKEVAEALAAEKQRLLSTMSHEVRTPLHGISSAADLLRDVPMSAEHQELVRALSSSAHHLASLVNDLLDWSRLDSGTPDAEAAACDLASVVREVADALRGRAAERGLDLAVEVSGDFPETLRASEVRMRQVFYNLIGNAVKFTERGEVRVTLDLAGPRTVRARVRDSGAGIDPALHGRLFEPFSPAARATAARYGGTGLGLAITRRIVAQHGGEIAVASEPGHGATFTVTLPLRAASGRGTSPAARPADGLRGMRVLLAEDNPMIQLVTSRMLRHWNVDPTVVDDGAQCLDALERRPFDVVLMDLQMPVMDGFEAIARLRAHARPELRRVPVIALTADATPEARSRARDAGVDAFFTKPYRAEELYGALAALRARG